MNGPKIQRRLIINAPPNIHNALDLYKRIGAVAHKVPDRGKLARDSMLAIYRGRLTYTFIMEQEVASIHYDMERREIFFKGHNIRNMDLSEAHRQALMDLSEVLRAEQDARGFYQSYEATLARILADKNK